MAQHLPGQAPRRRRRKKEDDNPNDGRRTGLRVLLSIVGAFVVLSLFIPVDVLVAIFTLQGASSLFEGAVFLEAVFIAGAIFFFLPGSFLGEE